MATFKEILNVIIVSLKFCVFSYLLWKVMGEELLGVGQDKSKTLQFYFKDICTFKIFILYLQLRYIYLRI
jgi:hypothetical protein